MSHLQTTTITKAYLALVSRIEIQDNLKLGSFLCFFRDFSSIPTIRTPGPPKKEEPTGCNYLRFPVDNEDLGKFGIRQKDPFSS